MVKPVTYELRYDYTKPKNDENAKLCYMDTEIFIVHAKTEYICKDIAKDIETRFNTSNIDLDRPFPKRTNHKWTNHKKKIVGLRAQTHSYLKDNNDKDKRQKALKKNEKKFEDERNCVEAVQVENKIDL